MGKAVKSVGKFIKDPKRVVTAVATGGLSETARAAKKGLSGILGTGGSSIGGVNLDREPFDLNAEIQRQKPLLQGQIDRSLGEQGVTSPAKMEVLKRMAASASGQAPTLAEEQMRAAQEKGLAAQMASLQASRGGSPASARRQMLQGAMANSRQIGQDAAQTAFQERQQFLQNAAAQDQNAIDMLDRGFDLDTLNKRSLQDYEKARVGVASANADRAAADKASKRGQTAAILGGALGAAGSMFASDEKLKKNIKPAGKDIDSFLKQLKARRFEYKDQANGEGGRSGVMAQDLEKSNLGKKMVRNTPQGKMVDMANGYGTILAAQARLSERLEAIEKKKKGDA